MSNTYFEFKQFRIEQAMCAMKVTTDACIQGAWTPVLSGVKRVLDIGAGTGLLALMLAQRNTGISIDAVEFDHDAAKQASENVGASPWADRINIVEADIREFKAAHRYDLVITNPPFFNNSLLGDKDRKNHARHTLSLSYAGLLAAMEAHLDEGGYISILLPATEYELWKEMAMGSGWIETGKLSVKHRAHAPVKRVVGLFSKTGSTYIESVLTIQDDDGSYTAGFTELLSQFYLGL